MVSKNSYLDDTYVQNIHSAACALMLWIGKDNCTNNRDVAEQLYNETAVGNINSTIASLYQNPPADLAYWVRDTATTLGFAPRQAMAQGVGFNGLTPLLPIWKAFRNMAYVLLALAMIIIGFMVMLRQKIDPKTVVTVQNALPRIVIALILITFSYAIAGFLIDIMYLVIAFVNVVVSSGLVNRPQASPINLTSGGFGDLIHAVFDPVQYFNPASRIWDDVTAGGGANLFNDIKDGLIFNLIGIGPLFQFILGLAYLFALARILFLLLGAYTQILLSVLTGPLQILTDVFPGANGFTNWIKNIVSNLAMFPITIFLLLLGTRISQNLGGGTLWIPPLLPQLGGASAEIAKVLISLGIVLMIPSICHSAKEAFKSQPVASFGVNVGGAMNTGMQLLSAAFYIKQFRTNPHEVLAPPPSGGPHQGE